MLCDILNKGEGMEKVLIALALGVPLAIVIAAYVAIAIADLVL